MKTDHTLTASSSSIETAHCTGATRARSTARGRLGRVLVMPGACRRTLMASRATSTV